MEKNGFLRKVGELDMKVKNNRISEEQNFHEVSEIILRVNDYEDIFSDFDPRPHSRRALSDDFLFEAQKVSQDKVGDQIELRFLVPKGNKKGDLEGIIKKRLHEHFKRHYNLLTAEVKSMKFRGLSLAVFGAAMLIVSAYLSTILIESFRSHLISAILEPAGWFTAWYGLDQVFYWPKDKKMQLKFYEKMQRSQVVFDYY